MKSVRCAIYTRKSSEEGLEQDFNSLDAQREACSAYVLSQASEGWREIAEHYDDGGLSGGTLERPALQRLLADVVAGRIDIIVVYKVDRLTRSLLDFAKLVEAFDGAGVSFVSVTQSFNTTTSMGRLTLNMLLSFAQFEREVTAERIRDKIAASKARGMWMGGVPPLGYRPDGRSLAIVDEHAAIVRHIFDRYLALGNVRQLDAELNCAGIHAPSRALASGKTIGGRPLTRGQLYLMLKCVTYTGRIGHHGQIHAGLHPPIIDLATFDRVQALLAANRQGNEPRVRAASPSLLAGLIVDDKDQSLIATHANKDKARYRYYVSRSLHHGTGDQGMRIPAREIERVVWDRVARLFGDPIELIAIAWLDVRGGALTALHERCASIAAAGGAERHGIVSALIRQVHVAPDRIAIILDSERIATLLNVGRHPDAPDTITHAIDAEVARRGRAVRLIQAGQQPAQAPSASLTNLLVQARRWWSELREGELDITTLAAREGVTSSWMTRVVRLAFLSPQLVEAILAGRQPLDLDAKALTLDRIIEPSWQRQREWLTAA